MHESEEWFRLITFWFLFSFSVYIHDGKQFLQSFVNMSYMYV